MNMPQFKCPHCGQLQGQGIGPNFTTIAAPTAPGWTVVVLSCLNGACLAPLGAYTFPQQTN